MRCACWASSAARSWPAVNPEAASPLIALPTAFLTGALSGIVPSGMAEALALAIGFVEPPSLALGMWLSFTVGHVAAKLPWYWLGANAERVRWARGQRWIARARAMLERRPQYGLGVLGLSALTSVPPFHLASIAAGLVRVPVMPFVLLCLVGRLARFGVLALAPVVLRVP